MALTATNVKLDPDKVQLAKLKGVNISQICREALDSCLRISENDIDTLQSQLVEIRKQIQLLNLEEKLILSHLASLESCESLENQREALFNKWKKNIAYMMEHNTIDWNTQKQLFKFSSMDECERWLIRKLKNEGLI